MRALLIAAASLALAGCVTAGQADNAVATASQRLQTICRAEPAVHLAFVVLTGQQKLSPRIIRAEAQAHAAVTAVCTNPPENVTAALVTAAEAYAAVLEASAQAEGV
jgi:hypothetical protein